jgi:hypothetical protein
MEIAPVDFPLDETTVHELLAAQFSDLAVASVRYLHEGWDCTA